MFFFVLGCGGIEGRAEAFILIRDAEEERNLEMRKSFDSPDVAPTRSLLSAAKCGYRSEVREGIGTWGCGGGGPPPFQAPL